ncbi:hypothetical protein MNEG_0209 [Monoraphidium neglectum]|uniref:ABC transporter domain-containing protein n=1 Tax=Monoraphidium neglectum TaxID=145388 RepID=A0A0D2MZA7_9CHLO|nr:hypothetical protein MNEG_0209 [Monoraphidium neglectum]KIZ07740.1 hypothetical protein MNEG_0209 [Monoraphidium neglectum]|eukprot:XP_013906759.1 hypothetical protein MNEG_0209 [Monoraphidium neglectum]
MPTAPLAEVQIRTKGGLPQQPQPGEAVSIAGRGAGFKSQAAALYRKNAVYQRRNWCSNCCLLSAPIFFCLLLFGIQIAINKLLLTGDDYSCGCRCTKCCFEGNKNNCTAVTTGSCPYQCLENSKTECGYQYSTAKQAFFCNIPHPSSWPAVLQVPTEANRAAPWKPDPVLIYTGKDKTTSDKLASNLLPKPATTAAKLLSVREYLAEWSAANSGAGGGNLSVPGEVLTMMGMTLGSSAKVLAGVYVETAFINEELSTLWPEGTCEKLGLSGRTNVTLTEMVSAMVNASNTPASARTLNSQLKSLLATARGGADDSDLDSNTSTNAQALSLLTSLALNCTDMPAAFISTASEISRRLYCGYYQSRCGGVTGSQQYTAAYDWRSTTAKRFEPEIYYNDTYGLPVTASQGTVYQRLPAVINLAVNAWIRTFVGTNSSATLLGVQEAPKPASSLKLDFSNLLGPLFFTWVVQMLLPIFLMQLVYEKEKRLRMMMKMHGLGDGAYWLVTYTWFWALYVVYMIIFVAFGSLIGLNMFTKNSLGVQIVMYIIFGHNMIAFAFLLSCFFSSSKTATVFAYLVVFGTGLIGSLLLSRLMSGDFWYMTLVELIPSFALYRGLYEFGEYAYLAVYRDSFGISFSTLSEPGNGLKTVWAILIVEWFVFIALAWYLEQVFASGTGNRRHPLFFLDCFRKGHKAAANARLQAQAQEVSPITEQADDVAAEHARVNALVDYAGNPIILNLAIEKGECFGLLGPNGAGKSTSINMMVGLLEPTHGTALIGGYDIRSDMAAIYTLMGVCPQHDLLWETLTGREHLTFYGRLKGLQGKALLEAVESGLRAVNLWNNGVADKQARQYSGGMKRRLSVAISFVGDPLVVYLDEPSTGLDPASRRNLWDVVKSNKAGRGIVLTTHSMEEAETLCDRLGIFVDGRLVCIGNPKEITSRYGGYLVMTLTVAGGQESQARAFVERLAPNARLTYSVGGTLKFELPSDEVSLSGVFAAMAAAKADSSSQRLRVLDWGVANATLEEVFIKFARAIGAKAGE